MLMNARLSDPEFQKFSDLIYEHAGIFLKQEKKELLNARLSKRLRACQIESFQHYFEYISAPEQQDGEFVHFLDAVSTNFTSFFREIAHFNYLSSDVLPKIISDSYSPGERSCFFGLQRLHQEKNPILWPWYWTTISTRSRGRRPKLSRRTYPQRCSKKQSTASIPMSRSAKCRKIF